MTVLDAKIIGHRGDFLLDATFEVGTGVTALFGPSGAGKTSLLRAIAGLWRPEQGHVRLGSNDLFVSGSKDVPAHERSIGFVFQSPVLFPHMSVRKNLVYSKPAGTTVFDSVVSMLDLGALLDRMPKNLSGGEAQRVALGRALISEPQLLLLDEPLTGLDEARRESVFPYLERLCETAKIPILYVSHNRPEIERLAQRVLVVDKGSIIGDMSVTEYAEQTN